MRAPVRLAPRDHAERARRHAVPAPVADIVLDHHRAELRAHQRTSRADIQAGRLGAVLAHVAGHQPAKVMALIGGRLFDKCHVPPRRGAKARSVVVGHAGQQEPVLGHGVPFLAGDLAGLAADAHRGVGEEPDPRRVVALVTGLALHVGQRPVEPVPRHRGGVLAESRTGRADGGHRVPRSPWFTRRPRSSRSGPRRAPGR